MSFITDINVSLDAIDEQNLQAQGFFIINENLNKGVGGARIFLWYKRGANPAAAITRIQASFNDEMAEGLGKAGYTKICKDLNAGAGFISRPIYLWYFRGSGEYHTPIEDISVTTSVANEGQKFTRGWERLACDLNRGVGGDWIHIWMRRSEQTYICDVDATDSFGVDKENFQGGYIRVDEDTNSGPNGSFVFLWYRQTTDPERALTDLQVSTDENKMEELEQQGYTPVSVNLNDRSGADQVFMWYKKTKGANPIKAMTLIVNEEARPDYLRAGINVIDKNLNEGNCGPIYLCFNQ